MTSRQYAKASGEALENFKREVREPLERELKILRSKISRVVTERDTAMAMLELATNTAHEDTRRLDWLDKNWSQKIEDELGMENCNIRRAIDSQRLSSPNVKDEPRRGE